MIHFVTPYRRDKDLGKAYNEAFERYCDEDDWLCLRDIDTLFLTHDAPNIIEDYVNKFQHAGILTCFTNRISTLSNAQLLTGKVDNGTDIAHHIRMAEGQKEFTPTYGLITGDISGCLMVISKKTWNQHKFIEGHGCLGVDTDYIRRMHKAKLPVIRMNGIYIWHSYRLLQGISNKKHLQP